MQVFDGHSGEQCSEFVAKTLHMDLIKALKAEKGPLDEENVKKCIVAAVAKTDKEFLRIAKIRCVGPRAEWDRDLVGKRNADPLLRPPLQEAAGWLLLHRGSDPRPDHVRHQHRGFSRGPR